jgi:hypothetical protein
LKDQPVLARVLRGRAVSRYGRLGSAETSTMGGTENRVLVSLI